MKISAEHFSQDQYKIEDSVGYLLGRARTKLAKALDLALAEQGITHAQGSILLMLATGRYATAADLTRELYFDSASITRMIDRLEKRGLIIRSRKAGDRRAIDLRLSPAGQELGQRLPRIYADTLNRSFAGFSPEDLDILKGMLRKLLSDETN